jgi:hypothetical protein
MVPGIQISKIHCAFEEGYLPLPSFPDFPPPPYLGADRRKLYRRSTDRRQYQGSRVGWTRHGSCYVSSWAGRDGARVNRGGSGTAEDMPIPALPRTCRFRRCRGHADSGALEGPREPASAEGALRHRRGGLNARGGPPRARNGPCSDSSHYQGVHRQSPCHSQCRRPAGRLP